MITPALTLARSFTTRLRWGRLVICLAISGMLAAVEVTVPKYGVFEQSFSWPSSGYANPWEQVTLTMSLTAPSGQKTIIGGFFHSADLWKARFSPSELGQWAWSASIGDVSTSKSISGQFTVVASTETGFVRPNPYNKYRWIFDNGQSFSPVGIGDCISPSASHHGTFDLTLSSWGLDGDFRPPSPPEGNLVGIDTYMSAYGSAGVNLFRWSVDNCSFNLYATIATTGNFYLVEEGKAGDLLVQKLRQYGLRNFMAIFSYPPFPINATPEQLAAVKRYVKYVVDRYGAYVDFWDLMNEVGPPTPNLPIDDRWIVEIGAYLHSIDPYGHPVSTSWHRPDLGVIDITSPHWYESESEFSSDLVTRDKIWAWKAPGKPVVIGEQGNFFQNWDERSALRMRLRTWAAFFSEGTIVFWNTSFAKDYKSLAANIYLGPIERGYLKALQDFTRGVDPRAAVDWPHVNRPDLVRPFGLSSPNSYAAYLHAFTNHSSVTSGITVTLTSPVAGTATWLDAATGNVLSVHSVTAGPTTLSVPAFITDIALKITAATGPSNQPPLVTLTTPHNGDTVTEPAEITLTATAIDVDGTVNRVEFYQGATLLGSDSNSPFNFTWSNVAAGSYALTARAFDNLGATTVSGAAVVTVSSKNGSGLVAHWNLDDSHGSSALDSSANGNTGTLVNGPAWTQGVSGGALRFDGIDDAVSVTDTSVLRLVGNCTFALWVKKDREVSDWQRLIGKGNPTQRNYGIWEEAGLGKRILFQQYAANGTPIIDLFSASSIEVGSWYHIACVVNGNTVLLYINGKLDATGSRSGIPGTSSDPLTLAGGFHAPFPGSLDDVRVYARALSASEVAGLATTAAFAVSAAPAAVAPGQAITVTWSAPSGQASPLDWVGLYAVGTPDLSYDPNRWAYTGGTASGSTTFTAPAVGMYEVRYFLNNGSTKAATSSTITVSNPGSSTVQEGFESPAIGSGNYVYNPSGSSWSFVGGAGITGNNSGFTWGNPVAPEGAQVAFLQGDGSVHKSMTLNTSTYVLSFRAVQRVAWQQSWQVVRVRVDGAIVGTFIPTNSVYEEFTSSAFAVTAGSHLVVIEGVNPNGGDNTAFIDQVTVGPSLSAMPMGHG
jgi:hypothetical protein